MNLYRESLDETFIGFINGEITHNEARRQRVGRFFKKLGSSIKEKDIDPFLERYSEIYMSDRRATLGTIKTLTTLREYGYKIGVVTNGGEEIQVPKLKEIGVEYLVDVLLSSGAVGFAKPAPEIFAKALERLQSKKEETIMIGDSLEKDIEGAMRFGMQALYYAPKLKETSVVVDGVNVPVISHMEQVLTYLGIPSK
jgi:putative hydrolase of the HAD superfamily